MRVEAIIGNPIDAIHIVQKRSELGKPSAPTAAVFTLPHPVGKTAGFETVLILSHKPFHSKGLDNAFVWAVKTREEWTRFRQEFPGDLAFLRCGSLGTAFSARGKSHADLIWALMQLEHRLGYQNNFPCFRTSFSDLPRGIVDSTERRPRIVFTVPPACCPSDIRKHDWQVMEATGVLCTLGISGPFSVVPLSQLVT